LRFQQILQLNVSSFMFVIRPSLCMSTQLFHNKMTGDSWGTMSVLSKMYGGSELTCF